MRRTIRFRVTALAVMLSALLLVVFAILMTAVLRSQLADNLDEGISQRTDTIASVIAKSVPPQVFADEDLLLQVVDPNGALVSSSTNLAGAAPITSLRTGFRTVSNVPGRTEDFRVLVREISSASGPVTLIVGVNNDDITDPVTILSRLLAGTVPAVVLLLGALTWWLTGRTLKPVEKMRIELEEITGTNLGRRVAEPATGDEIDRLAHTMNQTLDRLDCAIRRQQRFVADASHELRSPLTRIRAELEVDLALGQPTDPATTERSVLEEAIELQRLVDDLLQLAHGDDGLTDTNFQPVDLDDIVLREARRVRERGRVVVDMQRVTAAQTMGDARQLARAVGNLFDNAERHATSTITVGLDEIGDRVRLTVSDDGDGISPENRAVIFERFTRLDDARTRDTGGTGLGLAIVRDIIQGHDGTITLDDGANDDSTETRFVVELPLVP